MDTSLLFTTLFRKYLENRCSPDEVDQLMALLKDDAYKEYAGEMIELQAAAQTDEHRPVDRALRERLEIRLQSILETEAPAITPVYQPSFLQRNRWWLAAAAIMLFVGTGAIIWLSRSPERAAVVQVKPESQLKNNDVVPGGNKAILTLANGATIILDSAANGTLAKQGSSVVSKKADGELEYQQAIGNARPDDPFGRGQSAIVTYNILSTPRGGQYQLVLPDGSKVWLNAASSIRYPTAFAGNERRVEITGEVYFEVSKVIDERGHKKTFVVDIGGSRDGASIEVLGTRFNVNAYEDEDAMKTTLLEGKVKTSMGNGQSAILNPGEQAGISANSRLTIDHSPDLEQVMAWKNGAFQFNGADIQTVMRQISRWYDVEVEYKGNISLHFAGTISRDVNISQVLEMLKKAGGLKTTVAGKKIIVMP